MNKRFSIPSTFELSNEIALNNPNFHLVKVRIMSSGKNYNGSSFTINSLNNAKDTVAYTPVLANIIKNDNDEWDYNGHDVNVDIKMDYNGNMIVEEEYIERPVGVFLNNSTEIKYDEELDVNYIQAYAILWGTYSKAVDVLKRDGTKDVSVEIECLQGEMREDGYYEIQEYNILGTTLLGGNNLPAIEGSKVEMYFSMNNDDKEYIDNLKHIDLLLHQFYRKEVNNVEEEKTQIEEVQQENFSEEDVIEPSIVIDKECDKEDKEEEFQQETEQVEEEKLYSQKEMDEAIANTKAEFSQAIAELEELRKFKAEYDKALEVQKLNDEMDNLLEQFNCDEELVKELREKVINKEISMEAFELQLWRNNQPIKKEFNKEKQSNKLPVMDSENKVSSVDELFNYYGIPKRK